MRSLAALLGLASGVLVIGETYSACGSASETSPAGDAGYFVRPAKDGGAVDAANEPPMGAADVGAEAPLPMGVWKQVPAAAPCPLVQAQMPPDPFPTRTWSSCGTGCQVADAWPAPLADKNALVVGSGGAYLGGEAYLYLSNDSQPQRVAVVRMSDGSTVAAARIDSMHYECVFSGYGSDAPLLFTAFQEDAGLFFGRASTEAGAPTQWQSQWVANRTPLLVSRFMFDEGHGIASNGGTVLWLPSTTATTFNVLDNSVSPVDSTSARGHLLVWNKNDNQHGWLMSYAADAGARSILLPEPSGTWINVVRVTDDRVVWLNVSGPQATQFTYSSARIDWMKYAAAPGPVATQAQAPGPTIPAQTALSDLAAGDDYAAAIGCDANANQDLRICHVYVARLSSGKIWAVPQRPGGNSFRKVLAIGPTEIVPCRARLAACFDPVRLQAPRADLDRASRRCRRKLVSVAQFGVSSTVAPVPLTWQSPCVTTTPRTVVV